MRRRRRECRRRGGICRWKARSGRDVGALPALLLLLGGLIAGHTAILVFAALGLALTGIPAFTEPLPVPGGTQIFPSDVILFLAIAAWAADRLMKRERDASRPAGPLATSWPLLALAMCISLAVLRGHERYGQGLFGQPMRIVIYAAIAVALIGVEPRVLWRGITVVFYLGAVIQSGFALFFMATGQSQTDSLALSTGGTRILALGTAMYLVGSLLCALLNLERSEDRFAAQIVHAVVAGLALFGIIVSFGRTTYAAVALLIPALLILRRRLRRSLLWLVPLLVPFLIVVALLAPVLDPTFGTDVDLPRGLRARDGHQRHLA